MDLNTTIEKINELSTLEEGWNGEDSFPVKKGFIDTAIEIANSIFVKHNRTPTFVAPTSNDGILLEYSGENDRLDIRMGDAPYIYINYLNNKKFEGKHVPYDMDYIDKVWEVKSVSRRRNRRVSETPFRVPLSYPLLMALGFKQHKTAIVETYNYLKGHFRINDALGRFSYKNEMLPEIKYLDELCKIYFEKTGQNLKLNHKYGR